MPLPAASTFAIGPDLAAPTISITSPTTGAYVSGTVTVTSTASDDRAVVGVQYQIDGVNVGAEVTSGGTWSYNLDTTAYGDLTDHTLTAIARDAAGHKTTSAAVTLHVANPNTATVTLGTFNGPGSGGSRRTYATAGSFASPNYTDALRSGSATWPGNPYVNWGFVVQVRLFWQADSPLGHTYESINGVAHDHATAAQVGGVQIGATLFDDSTGNASAWTTVANGTAGTVGLRDWLVAGQGGEGGLAYTGDILLQYRYQ